MVGDRHSVEIVVLFLDIVFGGIFVKKTGALHDKNLPFCYTRAY